MGKNGADTMFKDDFEIIAANLNSDALPAIHAHRLAADPQLSFGPYARNGKRILDIAGALLLLAVFLPLIIVITLTQLIGGGPVFFGHARVGQYGRSFHCLKFRTMVPDAQERLAALLAADPEARRQWEAEHKLDPDPRITWLGNFLRRSSLDELPQLLNVLRGEMSLVGPRPVTLEELPRYGDAAMHYLLLRPGLTGPWQVGGRNDTSYEARVAMDTAYADRISLLGDIAILLRTVRAVFEGTGK